jgi:hypothetical protein
MYNSILKKERFNNRDSFLSSRFWKRNPICAIYKNSLNWRRNNVCKFRNNNIMQLNICDLHKCIFTWHSLTEPITTCWKKQTYYDTKIKNHYAKINSGTCTGMALTIATDWLILSLRLFYVHVVTFVVNKNNIGRSYCFTSMTFWVKQFL